MGANFQFLLYDFTAARAKLRRIVCVYLNNHSTGTLSLVRSELNEPTPAGIRNALGQVTVLDHPLHIQIFERDQTVSIYELP